MSGRCKSKGGTLGKQQIASSNITNRLRSHCVARIMLRGVTAMVEQKIITSSGSGTAVQCIMQQRHECESTTRELER
ncbi:hypothetical protein V1477_000261 [Vespula maculifrons]|uniref:Uncharacterized protein n=3 Tax=Vespula TaxID=7451 RepID=A0A834MUX8_VESGE|nr:hypothetical protein HZH66_012030 [Vespula vulgaris]KAF7386145.1 hypothetical protein HZH68_013277 [Vespula germanica]